MSPLLFLSFLTWELGGKGSWGCLGRACVWGRARAGRRCLGHIERFVRAPLARRRGCRSVSTGRIKPGTPYYSIRGQSWWLWQDQFHIGITRLQFLGHQIFRALMFHGLCRLPYPVAHQQHRHSHGNEENRDDEQRERFQNRETRTPMTVRQRHCPAHKPGMKRRQMQE